MQGPIWHITLISFRKETEDAVREETFNRLQKLAQACGGNKDGILYWQVGKNLDLRKGVHLVAISVFENADVLERYKRHPRHVELTNFLGEVADWKVGDMERWAGGA